MHDAHWGLVDMDDSAALGLQVAFDLQGIDAWKT
jgi:hypothetical protein